MSNIIDFVTRRPVGQKAPILQHFGVVEPQRSKLHRLDLVIVLAVLRPAVARQLRPLAEQLRKKSQQARLPKSLHGSNAHSGSDLPEAFCGREWENDSGAWVLEVTITREFAAELMESLRAAGAVEHASDIAAVG